MVEESTAACHTLAQEATELGRMVSQFKIGQAAARIPASMNQASMNQASMNQASMNHTKEAARRLHASPGR
jgi:hypothetical protein